MALGQASLQQALALALKYKCPKWELNAVYANSLLLHWQHSPATVVPLVRQVFPALMERPYGTVHQLLLCTWPELQVLPHVPSLHVFLASSTLGASSFCFLHQPCIEHPSCFVNPASIFPLLWVPFLQRCCPFPKPEISTWPGFWDVFSAFVTMQ